MMMMELGTRYDSRKSFYGKAHVIYDGDTITLVSYTTNVARIRDGKIERLWGGYSATTMRHINEFSLQQGFGTLSKKEWDKMEVVK